MLYHTQKPYSCGHTLPLNIAMNIAIHFTNHSFHFTFKCLLTIQYSQNWLSCIYLTTDDVIVNDAIVYDDTVNDDIVYDDTVNDNIVYDDTVNDDIVHLGGNNSYTVIS